MKLFRNFLICQVVKMRAVFAFYFLLCSGLALYGQTPGAPTNLMVTPGDGYLAISFTPGSNGGSPITNYEYTLDGSTWNAFNPVVTSTTVVVSGLTNCTPYTIQLRAVNTSGSGASSSSETASPSNLVPGITWTSRTSAVNNSWNSITYGNGLFVAVANSGTGSRVMTSPDGITWTARTTGITVSVTHRVLTSNIATLTTSASHGMSVGMNVTVSGVNAVFNGTFTITAVTSNTFSYSKINPNITSSPVTPNGTAVVDKAWQSVTYGNGLFVAVADNGTGDQVMTSPDGIIWTKRSPSSNFLWKSVTFGNNLFVAVSYDGVMTSPDGITWTSRSAASNKSWSSVTYGNGLFVAVANIGTGSRVMTSPDGITWTSRSASADNLWNSVTYGNGLFIAVSSDGVMTSPDGITWTSRTSPLYNWLSVTYGNGLFVSVGNSGARVMTSPDGITWTTRTP